MATRDEPPAEVEALSDRQRAFFDAYVSNGFNARQAAIVAGFNPAWAVVRGSELSRNPKVRAAIEAHLADLGATKERVLQELVATAFKADLADFEDLGAGMTLKKLRKAGIDTRQIKEIKRRRLPGKKGGEEITIKLVDRQRALEHLTRILGLDGKKDDEHPERAQDKLAAAHAAMVAASLPPDPAETAAGHDTVQNRPGGPALGQDGAGEAQAGDEPGGRGEGDEA